MKIIPQHFAEVLCLPENIRHCLEREDLCVTLEGTKMHALPLHESHTGLKACVVQTLFICSGCDNVCFFDGFGKQ